MAMRFNSKLVLKIEDTYYRLDSKEEAQILGTVIVKCENLYVCKVTGKFNIINECKLQTVQLLSETEAKWFEKSDFIKAMTDVVVEEVKDNNVTTTLDEILERYKVVKTQGGFYR